MDNKFILELNELLEKIYSTTNFKNYDVESEINILHDKFINMVVPLLKKHEGEAIKYYEKREDYSKKIVDPVNNKVLDIIKSVKDEYKNKFNEEFTTQVASSYSAKMNLIGESDIDYFILFKPLTHERLINISQLLTKYNFYFDQIINKEKVNNVYYVFSTEIDGVEVEFKVRDIYYSKSVIALHQYIDNKLDHDLKILLTYAKYQLKLKSKEDKSFKGYNLFKTIFYNFCFKDIEDAFYIIT
uniref:Polymerase nucleotidyl transferase domain-containing protein n=1 Tax=viral metagenome TaxID=1070528 RepID=A0A6C0H0C3_9ZZZZ